MYILVILFSTLASLVLGVPDLGLSKHCRPDGLDSMNKGKLSVGDAITEANALATAGDHKLAARQWFKLLQRDYLWDTGRSTAQNRLASIIFNLAQSLSEMPDCLSDARSQYLKADNLFAELAGAAADRGLHKDTNAYSNLRAQALSGAATAERGLCGASTDGREHIAKGKKKHCLAGLRLLQKAQKLRPNDPRPVVNEGNAFMHLSKPVEAVNRYLAAAELDPAYTQHAHPHVLEFVRSRFHFHPGQMVRELVEIAWHYALPFLSVTADCIVQDGSLDQAPMISECTWQDFKAKNPRHVLAFEESVLASWKSRELRMLQSKY